MGVHNDFAQRIPRVNPPVDTLDQLRGSVADFAGFAYPIRIKGRTGALQASYQRSFSFTGSRRSEGPVAVSGFASPDAAAVLPTEFTVEGKGGFDTLSLSSGFEVHPQSPAGPEREPLDQRILADRRPPECPDGWVIGESKARGISRERT